MKKLFLFAASLLSYGLSAQAGQSIYIQNYSKFNVEFNLVRSNSANTIGNCSPYVESANTTGPLKLIHSPDYGSTPAEAFYKDFNSATAPNTNYPDTPTIDAWSINGAYPATPTPLPPLFNNATSWTEIKFTLYDQAGTNVGGFYKMGQMCNGPLIPDMNGYANAPVHGKWFTMGGSVWAIIQ